MTKALPIFCSSVVNCYVSGVALFISKENQKGGKEKKIIRCFTILDKENIFDRVWKIFTHVVSIRVHADVLEQKKTFKQEKSSWYTNINSVSLFWNTNMAAVTPCESAL